MLAGVIDFFKALTLMLRHPKLIGLALIPSGVALILSSVAIYYSFAYSDVFLNWMNIQIDDQSWLSSLVVGGSGFLVSILVCFIMPWLVMLVGFPLCEPLVGKVDVILGGEETEVSFYEGLSQGLLVSLGVAILGGGGALACLVLGWIPLFGQILLAFYVVVWGPLILCFDLCDGAFCRRFYSFSTRFRLLRSHLLSSMSVGFVAMLLISPPFLNLLGLPIAVIMGTLHVHRIQNSSELSTILESESEKK